MALFPSSDGIDLSHNQLIGLSAVDKGKHGQTKLCVLTCIYTPQFHKLATKSKIIYLWLLSSATEGFHRHV